MNIDEYVKNAAKQIRNKKERTQFEREMKNHILDRVEYYTDAGYDEETAIEKALGQMGEAEDIGTQIGMVHKNIGGIIFDIFWIILILANLLLLVFMIFSFSGETTNLDSIGRMEFGSFLIAQIAFFGLCRKGRHYAVSCALFVYNILYILTHVLTRNFYSEILLIIWMFISGHSADMAVLSNTWVKSGSIPLAVATLIMYALSVFAEICMLKNARDLLIRPNKNTHKKLNSIFRCFISVSGFFMGVMLLFSFSSSVRNDYDYRMVTGLYVIESDEKVDFSELDYERDGLFLDLNYDLFKTGPQGSCWDDLGLEDYGEAVGVEYYPTETDKLFYGRQTIRNTYSPSKRYVAVIPAEYEGVIYDYAVWFDTQETDVLEGKLDNRYYCESDYEITLKKDELFDIFKEKYFEEIKQAQEGNS